MEVEMPDKLKGVRDIMLIVMCGIWSLFGLYFVVFTIMNQVLVIDMQTSVMAMSKLLDERDRQIIEKFDLKPIRTKKR
jgi:hypothetical protein